MKKVLIIALSLGLIAFKPTFAFADVTCTPIYGGGQTCTGTNLIVNKTIQNATTLVFVDDLGPNDAFTAGSNITFHIAVQNTSNATISNITVKDVIPPFTNFVSGPGSFDTNSRNLTYTIANLSAGQTQTDTVVVQVVSTNQLPANKALLCKVDGESNQAIAIINNQPVSDMASFCIQNQVLGTQTPTTTTKGGKQIFPQPQVITTPPTGPEALPLMALFPTGALGYFLRKKAIRS